MYKELINQLKPKFQKTLEYLKNELASLQIGRATPSLVENLEVEAYGSRMPLKQLAAIHIPDPRTIVIQPWDKEILTQITKAIEDSNLNLKPITETDRIRLTIPPLDQERREALARVVREKAEEARIALRRQREETWRKIQDLEQEGKIREDDKYRAKDELQDLIDEYNEKIKEISEQKEKEILSL